MTTTPRPTITPAVVLGLTIMLLGIVLTLDVADVIEARHILRYWPVVLIVMGVLTMTQARDRSGVVWGGMQLLFGTWLLLTMLRVLPSRSWVLFWPLLLVVVGASMVMHALRREPARERRGDPSETVSILAIMGGGDRVSTANPFRGGDLFALMGGGRIDLRQAVIPPGESATIEVFSMMGGFEIIVPETWTVDDRTMPLMGGMSNETRPRVVPTATLVLRGFLMMGGLSIKN